MELLVACDFEFGYSSFEFIGLGRGEGAATELCTVGVGEYGLVSSLVLQFFSTEVFADFVRQITARRHWWRVSSNIGYAAVGAFNLAHGVKLSFEIIGIEDAHIPAIR